MKKEIDVTLLERVIHFYSFTGTFPFVQRCKLVVFMVCHMVATTYYLKKYWERSHIFNELTFFLFSIKILCSTIFSLVTFKNAFAQEKLWKRMFTDVNTFDYTMGGQKIILEENVLKFYSMFAIVNTFYIISDVLAYLSGAFLLTIALTFCSDVWNIHMIVTTLVFRKLNRMIEKRFEFLKRKTFEVYTTNYDENKFWNSKRLKTSHLLLMNIVKTSNELFGTKNLIIMLKLFIDILGNFNHFIMEDSQEQWKIELYIGMGSQTIISLVSIQKSRDHTMGNYVATTGNFSYSL